ncbi:MAG: 1-(5-phosphoribosyl)-5-[(5-phosphoribosylamino)methylideneamino]imidazole-4-carboxamide isomerase [Pseudomonadota bacterium]
MLLIPAIDLKEGKCVRLRQGRMDDDTVFSDDPVSVAGRWVDEGARRLHLVDLDGAFAGEPKNAQIVRAIREQHPALPLQIGGGIRNEEIAASYIDAGVSYVIIGTQAVREPEFVERLCASFADKVIVGLDARDGKVAVEGWAEGSDIDAIDLAQRFQGAGVAAIVYTDIARDGMMQGVNVEATSALARAIDIPVIASGGVTNLDDIENLCEVAGDGISGAIIGRALYEGTIDLADAKQLVGDMLGEGLA